MKKPKIKTLRRKLKKIFGEYIRKRDCLFSDGRCVTCGKQLRWNDAQANAGHYVSVGSATQGTEYDERNVRLQCVYCNNWSEGKKPEYSLFLIKRHGGGIIEELIKQSKWSLIDFAESLNATRVPIESTQEAYEFLIKHYTEKLEVL